MTPKIIPSDFFLRLVYSSSFNLNPLNKFTTSMPMFPQPIMPTTEFVRPVPNGAGIVPLYTKSIIYKCFNEITIMNKSI